MKIKSKSELPSWFNLSNYDVLSELEGIKLWNQVVKRFSIVDYLDSQDSKEENYFSEDDSYLWRAITAGQVILESSDTYKTKEELEREKEWAHELSEQQNDGLEEWQLEQRQQWDLANKESVSLSRSSSIKGLGIYSCHHITELFKDKGLIIDNKANDYVMIASPLALSDVNLGSKKNDINLYDGMTVFIEIDLGARRNDEIIDELTWLLPKWRKEVGVSEPDRLKVTPSTYKRIADYRIIPYLDLYIWALNNRVTISNSVLAVALFPNGEKGDTEIRQTILKFVSDLKRIYEENIDNL